MGSKGQRFGMKWNGQLYEVLRVTRSRECVVFSSSTIPIHTTYPKDGKLHMTREYNASEDDRRMYASEGRPSFSDLRQPLFIETHAGFAERKELSDIYDIVDVDSFECKQPSVMIYVSPPDIVKANTIVQTYRGERRIVKFDDIWVVLWFVDETQTLKRAI